MQIETVVDYLNEMMAVDVEFSGIGNCYFYEESLITISNKQSNRSKLFSLLHEAGHHVLRQSDDRFNDNNLTGSKTKSRRMNILHEEFLDWDEGLRLAKKIGLHVDLEQWRKFSQKNLFDYVLWTCDPKKFEEKNAAKKSKNTV